MEKTFVLVVGGSGYLGLHLLQSLSSIADKPYVLAFTYHSHPPPAALFDAIGPQVQAFKVDLQSGEGLDNISAALGQPHVVVNCAALSIPWACESNTSAAMAINVPSALIKWMSSDNDTETPLLIHLSTDQVYEGIKSFYKEDDKTNPVNVYGKSKVMAEEFIESNYSNYAILRSSIIYGPQPIIPVEKSLPIQWIDGVLSSAKEVQFFHDEFRCPVFVKDVVNVIESLIRKWNSGDECIQTLLNVGGPDRVSRVQMAKVVADLRGYDNSRIKSVSAASVNRGVASPADISMDVRKLVSFLGINLTTFRDGVQSTLEYQE
uniref:RmlD-like substrate binding domain-containing protein n=1 Tax=Araucaria cunninghamii TaxID=56994 RepID=A0A0D6QR03_ARACU